MPITSPPNYVDVIPRPVWSSGSAVNGLGQRRVEKRKDKVKATDVNELRDMVDIMFNHVHSYTDSIGSC